MAMQHPPISKPPTVISTSEENDDDLELVKSSQHDSQQFVHLYDLYCQRIHGFVRMRVGNRDLAEDITSKVFVSALSNIRKYRGEGRFEAWLFRIAQNEVHKAYKEERKKHGLEYGMLEQEASPYQVEDMVIERDFIRRVRAIVNLFPEDDKDLLSLRFGAGWSSAKIAEQLAQSPVRVRVRLHRLLRLIKRRLEHEEE